MKINFKESDPKKIIEKIETIMGGRKLSSMVSFDLDADKLIIAISKLGKSTLEFKVSKAKEGLDLNLVQEKIALSHRAFKNEVTEKIVQVIEQAGGRVST